VNVIASSSPPGECRQGNQQPVMEPYPKEPHTSPIYLRHIVYRTNVSGRSIRRDDSLYNLSHIDQLAIQFYIHWRGGGVMLRVAIVILALCAVTVPNVFAECAWILWEKTEEGRESIERVFSLAQGQGWF